MIDSAKKLANEDALVTFGITPTAPETGYGYIEADGNDVKFFHEKPTLAKAKEYIKEKNFLWNSGIFCFKARVYLQELEKNAPDIYAATKAAFDNADKGEFLRILTDDMLSIPDNSIDYAVLEKSSCVKVVHTSIEWNDIGSFDALDTIFEKDENNNTKINNLVALESENNFVFGKYKTIALNHVNDMIIVETPTALLVSKKGESQNIKEIVKMVKQQQPSLVEFGRTVFRPWGKFTNLLESVRFKVKSIYVDKGKRLSLQKHLHRSEHWTVVQGTALVEIDDKEFLLRPNESTYIPIGAKHRLCNIGKVRLELIEVQVGEYLEEDDIIRFSDDFSRV
jgi:mannose-1-phosphate guanylyltransferase